MITHIIFYLLLLVPLRAEYKHTFINKAPYAASIRLTFDQEAIPVGKRSAAACQETTFNVEAGKQKVYQGPCKLLSVRVEFSEHAPGFGLELDKEGSGSDNLLAPGDTVWEYNGTFLIPIQGVRTGSGDMNPTYKITNTSSQPVHISLKFYGCMLNGYNDAEVKKISIAPGQTFSEQNPCSLQYIEAEGAYSKRSGYGDAVIHFGRYRGDKLQFHSIAGKSTEWTYSEQNGLIPTKGVWFVGKEHLDRAGTHKAEDTIQAKEQKYTITNKTSNEIYVSLRFYGCEDMKDIRIEAGKTVIKQSACQLKYIEVEEWDRASYHSGQPDTTELYLSERPAHFQFHVPKGIQSIWEYSKEGLVPVAGVQFIGKEKLDLLEKVAS